MNLFEAVCLFWWLAFGAIGHACWCAAWYRTHEDRPWLEPDFVPATVLASMGGLVTLAFAVCFEPGRRM